jgi:AI-2 transport protein TqsA
MWWNRRKKTRVNAEEERQRALAVAESPSSTGPPRAAIILVGLASAVIATFGLWTIQSIATPVLLALVLTICVHPLRVRLERLGVSRGVATGSVVAAVFLLLAAFVIALVLSISQFVALLPQFSKQLHELGDAIGDALSSLGFGQAQVQALVAGFDPANILSFATGLLGGVTNVAFGLVIVLTSLILMAMDASFLPAIFTQLRPRRERLVLALTSYAASVRRYMVVTTGLGIAQGALNAFALWILGVPGAFLWGLLSFLCSFIPNIGYFIAFIPPLVFGFLTGGVATLVWIIVIYAIVNGVVQSVIQPRVVGNAVALSQTITFVSVLVWAVVLGPVGAILAIPLTLLVRSVLIDSDPNARWWRPLIGDLVETKELMRAEDEERVRSRKNKSGR